MDDEKSHPVPAVSGTAREHRQKRQFLNLFLYFLWRWALTVVLLVSFAGALVGYSAKGVLDRGQKHTLNAISAAAFIALSINLASSMSHMAGQAKWRFLSMRPLPPEMFEMVVQLAHPSCVMKLFWRSKGAPLVRIGCICWLMVALAAQVGVTVLGLAYEIENPQDIGSTVILSKVGRGLTADFSFISDYVAGESGKNLTVDPLFGYANEPPVDSPEWLSTQRATANIYGLQSTEFGEAPYRTAGEVKEGLFTLDANVTSDWVFWLNLIPDFPADYNDLTNNIISHRCIGSYAHCRILPIEKVTYGNVSTISFTNAGQNESFRVDNDIWNTTTYISDSAADYGPRSTRVVVFWSGRNATTLEEVTMLHDCNSTVTQTLFFTNASLPIYNGNPDLFLNETQAKIFAGAAGWSGYNSNETYQTHTYSDNSRWSYTEPLDIHVVASEFVSRFSAGSIHAFTNIGPRKLVDGILLPDGGTVLHVSWYQVIPLLISLGLGHLLLLLVALWVIHPVVVLDDSPYTQALFLRPLLEDIKRGGLMIKGKELGRRIPAQYVYTWTGGKEHAAPRNLVALRTPAADYPERFSDGLYD